MRLGDRSSTILLAVITIVLALAVGLIIPLAAGNSLGGRPQPWTPPPSPTPTSVPPTATALPNAGAKSTSPTATRVQPTATRSTVATLAATVAPTVTVALTNAAVISPTATLTPSAAAAAPRAQVREGPLVLRAGPNQSQPTISSAQVGQAFTVTGRTADNAWLQVCCVNNEPAWLASQFVVVTGTLTTLPVKP
jgi:uncharacterized protein YraI